MAFADQQAGQIFDRILDIGRIDGGGDAIGGERCGGAGHLIGRTGVTVADDDNGLALVGVILGKGGQGQQGAGGERHGKRAPKGRARTLGHGGSIG